MNRALTAGLVVAGLAVAAAGGWAARGFVPSAQPAAHDMSHNMSDMAHADVLPPGTESSYKCRSGAFVEASEIVNSVTDVALSLPANTPEAARKTLDTVLFTALKQAGAEVHCVAGVLQHNYGRAYGGVIRRGADLARMRGLPKDVVALARATADALERNQPVQAGEVARAVAEARR